MDPTGETQTPTESVNSVPQGKNARVITTGPYAEQIKDQLSIGNRDHARNFLSKLFPPASLSEEQQRTINDEEQVIKDYLKQEMQEVGLDSSHVDDLEVYVGVSKSPQTTKEAGVSRTGIATLLMYDGDSELERFKTLAHELSHAAGYALIGDTEARSVTSANGFFRGNTGEFLENAMANWDAVRVCIFSRENVHVSEDFKTRIQQIEDLKEKYPGIVPQYLSTEETALLLPEVIVDEAGNVNTSFDLIEHLIIRRLALAVGRQYSDSTASDQEIIERGRKMLQNSRWDVVNDPYFLIYDTFGDAGKPWADIVINTIEHPDASGYAQLAQAVSYLEQGSA